jgi:hypothetical protein
VVAPDLTITINIDKGWESCISLGEDWRFSHRVGKVTELCITVEYIKSNLFSTVKLERAFVDEKFILILSLWQELMR